MGTSLEKLFGGFQVRFFGEPHHRMHVTAALARELNVTITSGGVAGLDTQSDQMGAGGGLFLGQYQGAVKQFLLADQVVRRENPHNYIAAKPFAQDEGCQSDGGCGIAGSRFDE